LRRVPNLLPLFVILLVLGAVALLGARDHGGRTSNVSALSGGGSGMARGTYILDTTTAALQRIDEHESGSLVWTADGLLVSVGLPIDGGAIRLFSADAAPIATLPPPVPPDLTNALQPAPLTALVDGGVAVDLSAVDLKSGGVTPLIEPKPDALEQPSVSLDGR
jgi:hypothetical protein